MELALGIDSRDIPTARYADPKEQLERLEAEEKKYETIIKASRVAKYGSLGTVPFLFFSEPGHGALAFTAATVAAFAEDRAKQKSMALKIKKEEIKRAKNPQLYVEQYIEEMKRRSEESEAKYKRYMENIAGKSTYDLANAYDESKADKETLEQYTKAYEVAQKNGKMEELSHLICRYESYKVIEPPRIQHGLRELCHGFGYAFGCSVAGIYMGCGSPADKIASGIILAEMGAIFVKNVARLVKNHKINKEEEKAYDAVKEFAQKHNNQEKVR